MRARKRRKFNPFEGKSVIVAEQQKLGWGIKSGHFYIVLQLMKKTEVGFAVLKIRF